MFCTSTPLVYCQRHFGPKKMTSSKIMKCPVFNADPKHEGHDKKDSSQNCVRDAFPRVFSLKKMKGISCPLTLAAFVVVLNHQRRTWKPVALKNAQLRCIAIDLYKKETFLSPVTRKIRETPSRYLWVCLCSLHIFYERWLLKRCCCYAYKRQASKSARRTGSHLATNSVINQRL